MSCLAFKTPLQTIGVARIFDWGGGGKPQLTCNDVIKILQKRKFLWGKIIVEWKIWSRSLLALNHHFGIGRGRKVIARTSKCVTWETCWVTSLLVSNLNIQVKPPRHRWPATRRKVFMFQLLKMQSRLKAAVTNSLQSVFWKPKNSLI